MVCNRRMQPHAAVCQSEGPRFDSPSACHGSSVTIPIYSPPHCPGQAPLAPCATMTSSQMPWLRRGTNRFALTTGTSAAAAPGLRST